jgi:CRP/FNR family transcriptional regulator, cyclic AMP receptor protein
MDEKRLKSVPFFGALGRRERKTLARFADEIDVPEGQRLAREGEFAHEFFVIEQGTAEVTHDDEAIARLGPGDFFGEVGIFASERRMATVTALSPMELIVLTSGALRTVRREHPEVAERLRKAIDERFATAF